MVCTRLVVEGMYMPNSTLKYVHILFRSLDNPHLNEGFPTTVYLRYEHNHPGNCADSTKRQDVSDQTVAKLEELSESGHSPSSAHEVIQCDSQEASVDRAICPDLPFWNRYDTLDKCHFHILATHSLCQKRKQNGLCSKHHDLRSVGDIALNPSLRKSNRE